MRHIYKELRQKFVDSLRQDLIGPYEEDEEIYESPTTSYIMGRLSPINDDYEFVQDQDTDFKADKESVPDEDEVIEELEEDDTLYVSKNKQSSAGLKVFVAKDITNLSVAMKWADYRHNEVEGKHNFKRFSKIFEENIDITSSNIVGILIDRDIYLSWIVHNLKTDSRMISVYIENRRKHIKDNVEKHIFQVELKLIGDSEIFKSENLAYGKQEAEDYFYNKKPVFARGYGCAAVWNEVVGNYAKVIKTDFLPEQEISGMDADLEKFKDYFSMLEFSKSENMDSTIDKLETILGDYALWISRLESHEYMKDEDYKAIGRETIDGCYNNLDRMNEGLGFIKNNDKAYKAFYL